MRKILVAPAVLAVGLLTCGSAFADEDLFNANQTSLDASLNIPHSTTEQFDAIRGQSVADRPRPDFDPVPISVGSFQLFPALNVGTYYDSNIFSVQSGGTDDEVWKVNPTVTLASNWGRNAVAITALGDFNNYVNNDEQNYYAGAVQAEGRYDIADQTWLAGSGGYQRVVELRGTTNTFGNALGPSEYNLYTSSAEAYRGVGLVHLKADYDFGYYDYQPYDLIGGGSQSQDTRDRTQNKASAEASYNGSENLKPFVRAAYDFRNYTNGGINSSQGYAIDGGVRADLGGVTTAEGYVGYLSQNYENYNNGNVGAVDFGADILWNVTPLTSVEGKANRSIEETDQSGASSILLSQGGVTIQHELRRNLILQGSATYYALNYEQTTRRDNIYDAGTGLRYYFNRHLYSDLTYDFERRNVETIDGLDYDRSVAFIRFGVQY